jgi:hypothetical protein
MDRELDWAKGKPEEADALNTSAATAIYFGKFKEGAELEKRSQDLLQARGDKENMAHGLMSLAGDLLVVGRCAEAKTHAKTALSLSRGQTVLFPGAVNFTACDDQAQSQLLLDELRKQYPKSSFVSALVTPMVQAEFERSRGNLDQAIQLLETVRAYDLGIPVGVGTNYLRGNLYLKARRGSEAAAEFKKIIDHPGIEPFSPVHVQAHLCLGRALAITGDTAGARKAYQDFLALWKDADADLPVLIEAKKEYEQLK